MLPRSVCVVLAAVVALAERTPASDVVDLAASLIGRPYVWGAEGPSAFDCSGLTQYVFREFAVDLPRRAINQSRVGQPIGRRMQRGDLIFFSSDTRRSLVTHVGIYEGSGRMIEASKRHGRVRRSHLDDGYWVERFMFARRVLAAGPGEGSARDRRAGRRDEGGVRTGRTADVRRVARRALEELAGVLIRRPR
ncbi:MAG TPA: C40 family peptidase [Vicinamibacterales bacterium]|nr:C40 family peptidase [Vicinamibacterales bacterium]